MQSRSRAAGPMSKPPPNVWGLARYELSWLLKDWMIIEFFSAVGNTWVTAQVSIQSQCCHLVLQGARSPGKISKYTIKQDQWG